MFGKQMQKGVLLSECILVYLQSLYGTVIKLPGKFQKQYAWKPNYLKLIHNNVHTDMNERKLPSFPHKALHLVVATHCETKKNAINKASMKIVYVDIQAKYLSILWSILRLIY